MELSSAAFDSGTAIPARFTCDGQNSSPPLSWSGVPQNTAAFALIVDDPDAPGGTFTHWVLFNLPAHLWSLPQGVPQTEVLADGSTQGRNDFGTLGYGGPCPPPGKPHHYRFTLYALDRPLDLSARATKQQALKAIQGHMLDQAQLVGIYQRKPSSSGAPKR
jgi:Raf kinase inhibitor-like YbhB/YbcL family protein